jgi:hypothetical protein
VLLLLLLLLLLNNKIYLMQLRQNLQFLHTMSSARMTRCSSAPVPADGFGAICRHTVTQLMHQTYIKQCTRMSLCGCKLEPPQSFIVLRGCTEATLVHEITELVLRGI